jgi:hypothetical protein
MAGIVLQPGGFVGCGKLAEVPGCQGASELSCIISNV